VGAGPADIWASCWDQHGLRSRALCRYHPLCSAEHLPAGQKNTDRCGEALLTAGRVVRLRSTRTSGLSQLSWLSSEFSFSRALIVLGIDCDLIQFTLNSARTLACQGTAFLTLVQERIFIHWGRAFVIARVYAFQCARSLCPNNSGLLQGPVADVRRRNSPEFPAELLLFSARPHMESRHDELPPPGDFFTDAWDDRRRERRFYAGRAVACAISRGWRDHDGWSQPA
jgi:hypothetical protein